jgi:hypothetical protein
MVVSGLKGALLARWARGNLDALAALSDTRPPSSSSSSSALDRRRLLSLSPTNCCLLASDQVTLDE